MSALDIAEADITDDEQAFLLDVVMGDGLSAGVNEAGEIVVTCRTHDGAATVSMAPVFARAAEHDLRVVDGDARWDSETVELVVVDGGWQTGGDNEGGDGQ